MAATKVARSRLALPVEQSKEGLPYFTCNNLAHANDWGEQQPFEKSSGFRRAVFSRLPVEVLLTISPNLLEELSKSFEPITRKLSREIAKAADAEKINLDEKGFRFEFNEDPMAVEKTAEGIRKFSADIVKLEKLIASRI